MDRVRHCLFCPNVIGKYDSNICDDCWDGMTTKWTNIGVVR